MATFHYRARTRKDRASDEPRGAAHEGEADETFEDYHDTASGSQRSKRGE